MEYPAITEFSEERRDFLANLIKGLRYGSEFCMANMFHEDGSPSCIAGYAANLLDPKREKDYHYRCSSIQDSGMHAIMDFLGCDKYTALYLFSGIFSKKSQRWITPAEAAAAIQSRTSAKR